MKFTLPANHKPGMRVPRGGSMCANCKFLKDPVKRICGEPNFIAWDDPDKPAGSDKIPLSVDEFCSDWYMPAKKPSNSGKIVSTWERYLSGEHLKKKE